jgi:solute carrier family 20 (sodium-dependent phosphate transporter)
LKAGFFTVPIYFGLTSSVLTMMIVWKGAPALKLDHWNTGQIIGCIFGVAAGVVLISVLFFVPYYHRKLVKEDWTLKS